MALIKCPECGKEISDMANSCPNCGYPIKENTQHNENTKKIYEYICDSDQCISICPVKEFNNFLGATCKCPDCGAVAEYTETEVISNKTGKVINRYREHGFERPIQQSQQNVPHCPKCNSTAITTGARGVSWFWGTIGSSKTVNRCANCGYTWKPKNW
jgi:ribosomal protein L37E